MLFRSLPLRTFLQTFIDQRFYPRTYDAEQVLAPFKATLRAVVDPDQLSENILPESSGSEVAAVVLFPRWPG